MKRGAPRNRAPDDRRSPPMPEGTGTIAVIDVGTNTARMAVFGVTRGRLTMLEEADVVTRLGEGIGGRRLTDEAMARTLKAVGGFVERIGKRGAERTLTACTSAARDAVNCGEFIAALERLGLAPRVLTGGREAELVFRGVVEGRGRRWGTSLLVIDVGGGSTELIAGSGRVPDHLVSMDLGAVRLTERFIRSDPPGAAEVKEMERFAEAAVREATGGFAVPRGAVMVGVAGTVASLAMILQRLRRFEARKVHGYNMTRGRLLRAYERLCAAGVEERKRMPGMEPGRADVMPAGTCVLLAAMKRFGFERVEVSLNDLRHGMALEEPGW
ncbi:MAG: Ppx/GppA phosphatase family protein [bacterium]